METMGIDNNDTPELPKVAYWLVEQLQRSRDSFRIVAIFNEEAPARAFAAEHTQNYHPVLVNGVISFEQLVDCLVAERFWPLSELANKQPKEMIAEIARAEVRKFAETMA